MTNNKKIAWRAQLVRNHGEVIMDDLKEQGVYEPIVGSNYRLNELLAAVAVEQLKKIEKLNKPRLALANYLSLRLKKFGWLAPVKVLKNSTHVYYVYPFKFFAQRAGFSRAVFAAAMAAEGFPLNEGYVKPLYLMPLYQKKEVYSRSRFPFVSREYSLAINYRRGICPVAERLYEKELLLTTICRPPLTKKEMDLFIGAIEKIFTNREELINYEKRKK